jgi:hypothetical protein
LFFEKINKIDKALANLTKMRREQTQTSKIRNKKGVITKTPWRSSESSENTLRTHIRINLETLKKWSNY